MQVGRFWIRVMFKPRNFWMGAYIKEPFWEGGHRVQEIYVCILPMLPVLISWTIATYE